MSTSTFSAGTLVEIDGHRHVLLRKIDADLWQLEEVRSKRITELAERDLQSAYVQGKLGFCEDDREGSPSVSKPRPPDYPPEQWERAKIRRMYVHAILGLPGTRRAIAAVIQTTWDNLRQPDRPPAASTVLEWRSVYLKAGKDITALIERHAAKGNKKPRYPAEVEQFAKDAIDARYMTLHRGTIQDVVDYAAASVCRENAMRPQKMQLPLPTRRLVKRLIQEIPAFDRYAARHGRIAAVKVFRSVQAHRVTVAPLERVEIDHTLLDLFVIDDRTGLPLGRPWLTVSIDDYSRCVLGVYVGFEPPSYLTVARCLKTALLPKSWLPEKYPSIKCQWLAHGVMRELVVDNGTEFHSISLENACFTLGIEIHYAPRKVAWFKGKVERFIGTANRGVAHGTPGTTFANIFEKDDYDPSKHAIVRQSTLLEIVHKWIVDVYHQKPHRALGVPPALMWTRSIATEDIRLPTDPERLDAILGRSETRMLTHKGIELNGLLYNSPELTALRRRLGDRFEVEVRVDATDIGAIIVLPPDRGPLIRAHALATDYAGGLSEWQHKVIRRYAAREAGRSDLQGWVEAKREIAELIDRELMHRKSKSRKRIARYQGNGSSRPAPPSPPRPDLPSATAVDPGPALASPAHPEAIPAVAPTKDIYPLTEGPVRKYTAILRKHTGPEAEAQE